MRIPRERHEYIAERQEKDCEPDRTHVFCCQTV
jgi:hypothetical protein